MWNSWRIGGRIGQGNRSILPVVEFVSIPVLLYIPVVMIDDHNLTLAENLGIMYFQLKIDKRKTGLSVK